MYSDEDVRKFFAKRGAIEMELGICRAQYHHCEDTMPDDVRRRVEQLEQDLMIMESLFCALSENERFVVRLHIIDQLDWSQVLSAFLRKWGADSGKTIRSLQIYQSKALRKITDALNQRTNAQPVHIK